jgi:hypothetical protein
MWLLAGVSVIYQFFKIGLMDRDPLFPLTGETEKVRGLLYVKANMPT